MKVSPRLVLACAFSGALAFVGWFAANLPTASAPSLLETNGAGRAATPTTRHAAESAEVSSQPAAAVANAADPRAAMGSRAAELLATIPAGEFRQSLARLNAGARERALTKLAQLEAPKEDFASLRAAADGGLYYVCALPSLPTATMTAHAARAKTTSGATATAAATATVASVAISAPPVRHSRAGAKNVLYLDFNGMTISGTRWNSTYGVTSYTAKAFDLDGDATTFNDAEQTAIVQIWARVAEDYAAFDVDVTTEEPATWTSTTGRALITAATDVNGVTMPDGQVAAGVSFVDVFGSFDYATSSSPALIYYTSFGGVVGNIAEAVAHELGHNVGLSHDGTVGLEYYGGHGSGDISWGPIMGAPYGRNVTQWSKGEYYNANNKQDDLAIIAAHLGYRGDEAGGTTATAAPVSVAATAAISASGIFLNSSDVDVFSLSTGAGTISIAASTYKAASGSNGGDADVKLELLNAAGKVVATSDVATSTNASLTYKATAGTYFARLTPAGTGSPLVSSPSGYTSYGSVGQYTLSGTVVAAPPTITSTTTASIGAGQAFSYAIVATNSPTSYGATGLPAGLAIDASTGVISGRATQTGSFKVALSATNLFGSGTATLALVVTNVAPVITAQSASFQVIEPGAAWSLGVTALSYSGTTTYQWKRNGVAISGATGSTLGGASAKMTDSGFYQVLVTNSVGTTTGAAIFMRVAPTSTQVFTWGDSTYGQGNVPSGLTTAVAIAAGPSHVLALKRDGTVVGWGDSGVGQTAVPSGLSGVVALAAGDYHSLALKSDGTVVAWGYSSNGQAVVPSGLANVVGIAAGYYHSLAVKADGTVVAWGDNTYGQSTVPAGLANVVAVSAGRFDSWALKADGTIIGWGESSSGQLKTPTGLTGVTAVAAGAEHTLALKSDGTVTAWGYNGFGNTPTGSGTIVAIAAGLYHSLAVNSGGAVVAWGYNGSGEITVPAGIAPAVAVSAGDYYSVALRDTSGTATSGGTVTPVNTAPTITGPGDQTVTAGSSVTVSFTVGDAETAATSLAVSVSSSDTALVPAAGLVLGGSGTSRTLSITPAANLSGAATITVKVSDGSLTTSASFGLTVKPANTAPTITTVASQTLAEDTPSGALAFTVGDAQTSASLLTVTASSSNTALIPSGGLVLGGSGASRTITITPAANASGTATITLTVSDGALTASRAFAVTVSAVNDAPTISAIAAQTIASGGSTAALPFTIGDLETAVASLTLTKSSSNTSLVPAANIVLGGSGTNRTVTVTAAAKLTGTATITLTVSDGTLKASTSFVVTVKTATAAAR